MDTGFLLMGIIPFVVYAVVDAWKGLHAGLIAAIVFAVMEVSYTLYRLGSLDHFSIASLVLIGLMGALAWKKNSEKFFFFQPVILGMAIGLYLLVSYGMGYYLMLDFMVKYQDLLPPMVRDQLSNPGYRNILKLTSLTSGICFVVHAGVLAIAALYWGKWVWLTIRVVGTWIAIILGNLLAVGLALLGVWA